MNACEKLTARVFQNRDSLRISRDDFLSYLETAVSDSGQPDLLGAIKMMKAAFRDNRGLTMDEFKQMQAAIAKAEGRVS